MKFPSFFIGMAFGLLIQYAMMPLLGVESWDGKSLASELYLPSTHIVLPALAGLCFASKLPVFSIGLFIGEIIYLFSFINDPLISVGVFMLTPFIVISVVAEMVTGVLIRARKNRENSVNP